jgi:hypothetical protein
MNGCREVALLGLTSSVALTVSLFISGLAFKGNPKLQAQVI